MRHKVHLFGLVLLLAACNADFSVRAPVGLTATPGEGQVTLKWQDRSFNETGFAVYRQEVSGQEVSGQGVGTQSVGELEQIAVKKPNVTEHIDKEIAPGKLYRYGVSALGRYNSPIVMSEEANPEPNPTPTPPAPTPNRAPVAEAQAVTTNEDEPVQVTLEGTDPESDTLSYKVETQPANGTLGALDSATGVVTYTPAANYSGQDSFTFTVSDGELTSDPATVTVTIGDVGDPPTDIALDNESVEENQDVGTVVGTLSATDADSTSFTYSLPAGEADNASFTVEGDQLKSAEVFDFETKESYSVRVEVSDGELSYQETFTVSVTDVDDTDPSVTFDDPGALAVDKEVTLTGTADDNVAVERVTLFEGDTELGNATLSDSNNTWSYAYTPTQTGQVTLKAVVSDAAGNKNEASTSAEVSSKVVTNGNDSGVGSLRQVVADAQPGATVSFASDIKTVILDGGEIVIDKDLTIEGNVTIDASTNSRIFTVSSGTTVILKDLTLTNGKVAQDGGGVSNLGTLTLQGDASISGNSASNYGGGVYNEGVLTLQDSSSISNNSADYGGGVLAYSSTFTVTDNASISGNTARINGGGVFISLSSTFTLSGSAGISSNTAGADGGGVHNRYDTVTLNDSASISGNMAVRGGGVMNERGTLQLSGNSNISDNAATDSGGGVYNFSGTLIGTDYDDQGGDDNIFNNTPSNVSP